MARIPFVGDAVKCVMKNVFKLTLGKSYKILQIDDKPRNAYPDETHTVLICSDDGKERMYYFPSQVNYEG
jgi:hypothetical protein